MATDSIDSVRDRVEQLLMAIDGFRGDAPEPFAEALQEYAAAIADVNARLRAAHALLRQGRRAEAVHACDLEPNVLDSASELDLVDQLLDAWMQTIDELGIPRPQRLLSDLAAELSAAYDIGHQLVSLIRQHRLLAIGRAPLEERVRVLRRIIEIDPENPSWQEDLAAYETVCKKELTDELAHLSTLSPDAVTPVVANRVKVLVKHVSSAIWLEPFEGSAVRRAQRVLNSVDKTRALAELADLAVQLADAHAAFDLPRAGELFDRWSELTAYGTLPASHPAAEAAARCRDWVLEERNREATEAAELQAAEDLRCLVGQRLPGSPGAARSAGDQLRTAMMQLQSIPAPRDGVTDRDLLLDEAARQLRRLDGVGVRFWGTIITAVVATIAVGGFTAARIGQHFDRGRVVADVRKDVLEERIAQERAAQGREAWDKWLARHPWLDQHPIAADVKEGIGNLEQKAEREKTKAEQYTKDAAVMIDRDVSPMIATIESFAPAEGNIQTVLEARQTVTSTLPVVDQKIETAEKRISFIREQLGEEIARPLAEELGHVRRTREDARARFQRQEAAVATRIEDDIDRDLSGFESEAMPTGNTIPLDRIRRRIEQLEALRSRAAPPLLARLDRVADRIQEQGRVESLVAELDRAARSSLSDYLDVVADRAKDTDLGDVAASLARVAADRSAIEAAQTWSTAVDAWAGNLSSDEPALAKWHRELEAALETEPGPNSTSEEKERLERVLSCLQERNDRSTRYVELLERRLDEPIMQPGVLFVDAPKGSRYYTRDPEKRNRKGFNTEETLGLYCKNAGEAKDPAPHVALGQELYRRLKSIAAGSIVYEEGLIDMLSLLDEKSQFRNCDPILRCVLIGAIVDALENRVLFDESEVLRELSDRIDDDIGGSPAWVNPEIRDEDLARKAERIVAKTNLVSRVIQDYRDRRANVERPPVFSRRLVFHGWLDKRRDVEKVRSASGAQGGGDGRLFVVTTGEGGFDFISVGEVRGGKTSLDHKPRLTFGQPVFISGLADVPRTSR